MYKSRNDRIFDVANILLLVLLVIVIAYPLYFTLIASVSEPVDVATGQVVLLPKGFTFDAYKEVFKDDRVWTGYANSLLYTVAGTLLSLALTIPAAYVLSKKNLRGRGVLSGYFIFTMFFSGGLIPTYLLVKDMNLLNKPYTLIVLGAFSVYNMVVARVFYETSIPSTLYEAAQIDGCSQFGQFFRIAIPLSKPIIAVIALYYAVSRWNDFFTALVYITKSDFYPLQLVLRNILLQNQTRMATMDASVLKAEELLYLTRQAYMAEAMKYALIFISSLPMLIAYPFVQKHFVKGVMIGSIKG
ncbi:MAG: carbohydrate ABC transporter permease [Oscillospiraceae bacterium]